MSTKNRRATVRGLTNGKNPRIYRYYALSNFRNFFCFLTFIQARHRRRAMTNITGNHLARRRYRHTSGVRNRFLRNIFYPLRGLYLRRDCYVCALRLNGVVVMRLHCAFRRVVLRVRRRVRHGRGLICRIANTLLQLPLFGDCIWRIFRCIRFVVVDILRGLVGGPNPKSRTHTDHEIQLPPTHTTKAHHSLPDDPHAEPRWHGLGIAAHDAVGA